MSTRLSPARPRRLVVELTELACATAKGRAETQARRTAAQSTTTQDFIDTRESIKSRFHAESATANEEYGRTICELNQWFETEHSKTEFDYKLWRERISIVFDSEMASAKKEFEKTRRAITTEFETAKSKAEQDLGAMLRQIKSKRNHARRIQQQAEELLRQSRQHKLARSEPPEPNLTGDDEIDWMDASGENIGKADEILAQLRGLFLPRMLKGYKFAFFSLLLAGSGAYPLAQVLGWTNGSLASAGGSILLTAAVYYAIFAASRTRLAGILHPLRQTVANACFAADQGRNEAKESSQRRLARITSKRDEQIAVAEEKHGSRRAEITQQRDDGWLDADEKYTRILAHLKHQRDVRLGWAMRTFPARIACVRRRRDEGLKQARQLLETRAREIDETFEKEQSDLEQRWTTGLAGYRQELDEISSESARLFPQWSQIGDDGWTPAVETPCAMRIGQVQVDLARITDCIPADDRLKAAGLDRFVVPSLLDFPRQCSVLLTATGDGVAAAEQAQQLIMLRYLTALPPGKVRFTIIDPVGLGQGFAAFMHLADFNELLVTNRIWTETNQIEHRLADLTEHMETVIQTYLRNEFETIEDYNEQAGEVAEPYRILVIANFPAKFSEAAAERLTSIAKSGAPCGVFTLVSLDADQQMPYGFDLAVLRASSAVLDWRGDRFALEDDDDRLPLDLDAPPDADEFGRIVKSLGGLAKDAHRVEVPFGSIAPSQEEWWTVDSRGGLSVALGPAGARKIQSLKLGRGTSQHVLVAGKTGSGKSTMMHVLITNLAMMYSPDEVELYLIDFKKGVEFKTYATNRLPHARVVAIESEREFGLSVMQRLDEELRLRGDKFRKQGAQDIKGYRDSGGTERMPRILLIVDEFQELFVEEDKIAQDASLVLDRLVRQGRAFGIHVFLGSQTLGGEYSLSRTTLGQMAVRIALQCSEADAHLILSDDNLAARLLTRPGEAIYNDANGRVEGNHPFQVAWLSDHDRERHLIHMTELAQSRNYRRQEPLIVFEGNIPAVTAKNVTLADLLEQRTWPESRRYFQIWLGDAIAIKDPTSVTFYRQSGSNLIIIGQNEDAARGMFTAAVVSLAAQHPIDAPAAGTAHARFYVLDGTPPDAPAADYLERIKSIVPHQVQFAEPRDAGTVVAEIAQEVTRRETEGDADAPSIYLIVHDLQRFRALRRKEDDFGFSSSLGDEEEPPAPEKQFPAILRDGPAVGVHTLVWCDGVKNLNRTFDRATIGEFEYRVLFQMSTADSSVLIDSPAASKLGPLRALYYHEEEERLEKFRPYGLPSKEWLRHVHEKLRARSG